MFGKRFVRGAGLALSSFSVLGFSNANTTLSLENFFGALVNNEAKNSWSIWFIRLFPDFISLWMLRKIGFFKNDLFEKIDRLSLSAKERMEADNYSEYVQEREKNNFFLDGAFDNVFDNFYDNNEIWDSVMVT